MRLRIKPLITTELLNYECSFPCLIYSWWSWFSQWLNLQEIRGKEIKEKWNKNAQTGRILERLWEMRKTRSGFYNECTLSCSLVSHYPLFFYFISFYSFFFLPYRSCFTWCHGFLFLCCTYCQLCSNFHLLFIVYFFSLLLLSSFTHLRIYIYIPLSLYC